MVTIVYKYNSRETLGFISTEGDGRTETGLPYLFHFLGNYYNIYILPVVRTHVLGWHFNACNAIYNHKRMRQYDLALKKHWVAHSRYFILETTVELDMWITDAKLIFCHVISDQIRDKRISMR